MEHGDFSARARRVCRECGARCCHMARPPLTMERREVLESRGAPPDSFCGGEYMHLAVKVDGFCTLLRDGMCSMHECKPETCVAGPFTFEVLPDGRIAMFLKEESICPLVGVLREDPGELSFQYGLALGSVRRLLRGLGRREIDALNAIDEPFTVLWAVEDPDGDGL